eukprot:scaffold26667_cov140-Skeletonema_menzelii.AAC.1
MRFGLASSALLIGIATIAFVDGEGTSITNDNDDSMKAKEQFGGAGEVPSDHQRLLPAQLPAQRLQVTFTKVGYGSCRSTPGNGGLSYLGFNGKATREDCESQCSSCAGGQLTGINLIGYMFRYDGTCYCYLDSQNFQKVCGAAGAAYGKATNVCEASGKRDSVCYKADTSPVCPILSPRPSVSPTQTQSQSPSSWPSASPTTSAMPSASPTTNSKASKARMPKSIKLNANAEDTILQAQKMKSEGSFIYISPVTLGLTLASALMLVLMPF